MWWAAIRLALSGAFERLLKGLSAAWKWIISDWRNGPLVWFAALFLVHAFIIAPSLRSRLASVTAERDAEQVAHAGTIAAFLEATAQAQRDAEANAARVQREQEIITDEVSRDYQVRLADLRLRFERLQSDAARADPGRSDPAHLPGLSGAAGRAHAAPPGDRLPAALSLEAALIASEQALQLAALIEWVERQQGVRFSPEPAR